MPLLLAAWSLAAAFARVRPEVTLNKTQADLDILARQLQEQYQKDYPQDNFRAIVVPLTSASVPVPSEPPTARVGLRTRVYL